MTPYWISWWHTSHLGPFEIHSPWWVSGEREDGARSICAAVMAEGAWEAGEVIRRCYDMPPESVEVRFAEPREPGWSPFSDRFPRAPWMRWPPQAQGREEGR